MYQLFSKIPLVFEVVVILGSLAFFNKYFEEGPLYISYTPPIILTDPIHKQIALVIVIVVLVWAIWRLIKTVIRKK